MTETALRSITNSGIWIPMLAPTCSTMISSDEPQCRGFNQPHIQFPLSNGTLLVRDSIVGIPIPRSVLLPASHFYSYRNAWSHDQTLGHLELIMMMHYRVGPEIRVKSQSRSVSTQQTLSEIPVVHLYNHPVTLWRLVHPKHSYGKWELHNLIVIGTCISHEESNSNILNDRVLC